MCVTLISHDMSGNPRVSGQFSLPFQKGELSCAPKHVQGITRGLQAGLQPGALVNRSCCTCKKGTYLTRASMSSRVACTAAAASADAIAWAAIFL